MVNLAIPAAEHLERLPASPGVYVMTGADGVPLYVGKAASLRHRVRSYFGAGQKSSPKLRQMVARVSGIDFFVTASEQEALILELNLIKRHRPHYNVRLKDDKTFPYLKIDMKQDWPRVQITRRVQDDGARYFGPFASARSVRQALNMIKGLFPFRSCSQPIKTDTRPCLDYHIHRCLAPCTGAVTREEYREVLKQVILFLEGKQGRLVRELEHRMSRAAENLDFEKAARLRDQLQAINEVVEWQRIATTVKGEQDVIALAGDKDLTCAQVLFIRGSRLIGRESFTLQGTRYEEPQSIMTSFVKQFYSSSSYVPPVLLLQHPVEDRAVIEEWLGNRRGGRVRIIVPRRGGKKQLVDTAAENAKHGLEQLRLASPATPEAALAEIKRELGLPAPPARIEGYDISNIQGRAAVGSMVVFNRGKPEPSGYRRFRIKTVSGADDYAMLREVFRRRFKRGELAGDGWAALPDLILIDGGKGQLKATLQAMAEVRAEPVPIASLAKENEEIFVPRRAEPIVLPRQSPALQLLQRVRDEAHRFAHSYHRRVHKRESFVSELDAIPGIGAKRKHALLRRFGSVPAIREASIEELTTASGITRNLAERIKQHYAG